jgi:PAS domain S-box-containing protein
VGSGEPWQTNLFRQWPVAIEFFSKEGRLMDANPACLELFGVESVASVVNYNLFEDPNLPDSAKDEIRNGKPVRYESEFDFEIPKSKHFYPTVRNGKCYIEYLIFPVYGPDGALEGYVTNVIETTKRKEAEQALAESRERYRNLIELAVDGVLIGSNNGLIIDANTCICEMTGRTRKDLIGRPIADSFFTAESVAQAPFEFERLRKGEIVVNERDILRPDLSTRHVEMRTRMMPDGTYQSIIRDISDRQQKEAELQKRNSELSAFNATKDKFLSIIAHDLKNPFNAILGFTNLLIQNLDNFDEEEIMNGLHTIKSASTHAYKLLENLLAWANHQTGRTRFNPEKINIREQINESAGMVESLAKQKNISLSVRINKSLTVYADKNMLDTILRNLISNAIKYSYNGSKVRISGEIKKKEICISVSDQGIGIHPNRIATLFKIDNRSITLGTDNEQGTGLGLILCKDFVLHHQGKIWLESTLNKGTTFTFSLPSA